MSPVKSIKHIPIYVFIPPTSDAERKTEIVTNSETIDITNYIITGEYTDGITDTIGNFTFTIDNTNQTFTDRISLYNQIKIYSDYATSATTLKFKGLIEKVSFSDEDIVITGRSTGSRVLGATVTYSTTNYTHEILSYILTTYASYITQTNIDATEATDTSITVNWYQKPFWECVLELCNRAGYDAYIDCNSDFHYFVSGSIENTTEAVVHDSNLIEVSDFTPDLTNVKNRIIVYGATTNGVPIIWTSEDSDSIDLYDVREEIISDTSIITPEQAKDRADYELSIKKDPPTIGEVTSEPLATILPGEKIRISDQVSGLNPITYNIQKFTQKFGDDECTVLTIQKEQSTISKVLKKRLTFESESTEKDNPNEMKYTWNFDFDADSGTHSNTKITTGVLKTTAASGTWISQLNSISSNATYYELRAVGETLTEVVYEFSTDGGNTWQHGDTGVIVLKTSYECAPPGTNLKIKVNLNSADSQIDALCLLYR